MELRKLNLKDAYAEWEYTSNLPEDENGLTNSFHGVSWEKYRDDLMVPWHTRAPYLFHILEQFSSHLFNKFKI